MSCERCEAEPKMFQIENEAHKWYTRKRSAKRTPSQLLKCSKSTLVENMPSSNRILYRVLRFCSFHKSFITSSSLLLFASKWICGDDIAEYICIVRARERKRVKTRLLYIFSRDEFPTENVFTGMCPSATIIYARVSWFYEINPLLANLSALISMNLLCSIEITILWPKHIFRT